MQEDLFPPESQETETEDLRPRDYFMGIYDWAARKYAGNIGDDMQCMTLEVLRDGNALTDTTQVTFYGVGPQYKSGPRKGQHKVDKSRRRDVYLKRSDVDALITAWERETGLCIHCKGGQRPSGWNAEGTTYAKCEKCNGTGKSN